MTHKITQHLTYTTPLRDIATPPSPGPLIGLAPRFPVRHVLLTHTTKRQAIPIEGVLNRETAMVTVSARVQQGFVLRTIPIEQDVVIT